LQSLRRDFKNFQMKDSKSIDQLSAQVMDVVTQLRENGDELPDQKVVENILRSFPNKFDNIVVTIDESKDLSQFSIDELFGSLLSHEYRLNKNNNVSLENSFKS
jgi:hypothetical protein